MPLAPPDLHDVRTALRHGRSHLAAVLERALDLSAGAACRHAYIVPPREQLHQALAQGPADLLHRPLAGLPISVKDLFDVEGQITRAGSVVLEGPAARQDAPAIARVRAAGGLIAGRTNMTEFAFSGVGINPHYGTPVNPADAQTQRIAGGSSSGAAVSVATGAAWAALGSDTGGSLRIPAALCGLVGYKGTARLVPTEGTVPLSTTLDTAGAISRSVRDAVLLHEILAGRPMTPPNRPLRGARLAVARTWMLDDLEPEVASAFERALHRLGRCGARIEDIELRDIADLATINAAGGFSAAESYAWHRERLAHSSDRYDPRVAKRILRGASMSAADYVDLLRQRRQWIAGMERQLHGFDAVISPTVPLLAPELAPLEVSEEAFFKVNALLLRNPSVVNMLDGCALSLPCQEAGKLPVGLMIWHTALRDDAVLALALQIESALAAAGS